MQLHEGGSTASVRKLSCCKAPLVDKYSVFGSRGETLGQEPSYRAVTVTVTPNVGLTVVAVIDAA